MYKSRYTYLAASVTASTGRKIGLGIFSLVTGFYCAEFCIAAVLGAVGADSAAQFARTSTFVVGTATASLGWALWRMQAAQKASATYPGTAERAVWIITTMTVAAFIFEVFT